MQVVNWVTSLFKSIDAKDTDAFLSHLDSDCIFRFGNFPEVKGTEAIRQAVSDFFGSIEALNHIIANTWETKNHIICNGMVTYTRKDLKKTTVPFCNVFLMEGNKIKDYQIFIDVSPLFS